MGAQFQLVVHLHSEVGLRWVAKVSCEGITIVPVVTANFGCHNPSSPVLVVKAPRLRKYLFLL